MVSETDLEQIARIHARWIADELANHSIATLDLCTDDVVFLPPNGPPLLGKEVIGQWLSSSGDQIQDIQISNLKIDGAESVSYLTANYATSYTISAAAATSKAQGVHLWILRKLNSGDWKVAVVMWSSFEE